MSKETISIIVTIFLFLIVVAFILYRFLPMLIVLATNLISLIIGLIVVLLGLYGLFKLILFIVNKAIL